MIPSTEEADITFPRGAPDRTADQHLAGCWDVDDARSLARIRHALTDIVAADTRTPDATTTTADATTDRTTDETADSAGYQASAGAGPVLTRPGERLALLFNEIAGNALRHGGHGVRADLRRCVGGWLLTVRDGGAGAPAMREQRPEAPGGHGLHLVMALSDHAGWYRENSAKVVWVDVRDAAPSHLVSRLRPRPG